MNLEELKLKKPEELLKEAEDLQIDNVMGTSLAWFDHNLDFIHFIWNNSNFQIP